ncbi:MAG: DUF2892 domain-containing protein [Paraglaciecola sp.]|uniref:YgaP family membrane protein n=1 Tax=Paraglaciecola sp. TaxID=1920173 RepID=UPI003264EA38
MIKKQNVGVLDTAIRSIVGVVCLAIAAKGLFSLSVSVTFLVIGVLIWITCSLGVCLIYKALNIDTYLGAGHGLTQWYPKT